MIFNESLYYLLLFLTSVVFFLVPTQKRRWVLVASGVLFYGYYAREYLIVVSLELFLAYHFTKQSSRKKTIGVICIIIGILGYFKYRFFAHNIINHFTSFFKAGSGLNGETIILPLAISFFTFEFVHFVIEKDHKNIKSVSFQELAAFIFFFPTMIAGPIKRFSAFNIQIDVVQLLPENVLSGVIRILLGLFKKIVIADTLSTIVGNLLTSSLAVSAVNPIRLWIALFSYSWQIFFDFSGYSDIAIGSARLFGFIVPENFQRPYFASNIASFWKRWHQSLYQWLIDYIFIPLGGNRLGLTRTCINILLTMIISGLWHGAGPNFIAWGLYHAILLIGYRLYTVYFANRTIFKSQNNILIRCVSTLTTFIFVSLGWVFFVAPTSVSLVVLKKLFLFIE